MVDVLGKGAQQVGELGLVAVGLRHGVQQVALEDAAAAEGGHDRRDAVREVQLVDLWCGFLKCGPFEAARSVWSSTH